MSGDFERRPEVESFLSDLREQIPGWDWTCCGFSAGEFDDTEDSLKVEALIAMVGRGTRDEAGLRVFYRLPPAVAVAIIHAFQSGDIVGFAKEHRDHPRMGDR